MNINKGFSHVGLSTLDMDATRDFYENVLGFKAVRCDILKVKEGGQIRHIFFDTGRDQYLAFMAPENVPTIDDYDAGINNALGVPGGFYHFAFEAGSVENLEAKREELLGQGCRSHRRRRPRVGQVHLLQGPQRYLPRVLPLRPRPRHREYDTDMQVRAEISIHGMRQNWDNMSQRGRVLGDREPALAR